MVKNEYKIGDIVFFNWNKETNGNWTTSKIIRNGIRVAQFVDIITDKLYSWDSIKCMNIEYFFTQFDFAFELSKWTHTGIITEVKKKSYVIHEALNNGFIKSDYDKEEMNKLVENEIIIVKRPNIKLTNIKKNATKYEGTPYGWIDLIKSFIAICLKMIPFSRLLNECVLKYIPIINWFINISSDKQLICVEANARILYDSSNKKINVSEEFNKTYDILTVSNLFISKYLDKIE